MNLLLPFSLNDADVKGRIIKLNEVVNQVVTQHEYPEYINFILADLLTTSCLIGSQFKTEVTLTIQLQSKDHKQYIIVDYQSPGFVRGYAKYSDDYINILKDSLLVITIDLHQKQRYQGIVEIDNSSISEAIEKYFYQSEQLDTSLKLKTVKLVMPGGKEIWCSGGVIIQRVPSGSYDSWNEANLYLKTLKDEEIVDPSLSLDELLYSLYNEMNVMVYDSIAIEHKCRCKRERIKEILISLGYEEVIKSLIDNKITVKCEFCNNIIEFSREDINNLFCKDNYEKI